jgi:hypothetical protein
MKKDEDMFTRSLKKMQMKVSVDEIFITEYNEKFVIERDPK